MSQKTFIAEFEKMLERGLITEFYKPIFEAEVNFLKSLSPASFLAWMAVYQAERVAYLKATEKEREFLSGSLRKAFLSALIEVMSLNHVDIGNESLPSHSRADGKAVSLVLSRSKSFGK